MSDPAPPRLAELGARFFQLGYVAHDLERAKAVFEAQHGVRRFKQIMNQPGFDVVLAYAGDTMIEIIAVSGEIEPTYAEAYAQGELVLHHLGYHMEPEAYRGLPTALAEMGVPITRRGGDDSGGFIYADTRKLFGHYSEYICIPMDSELFVDVPRN